MTSKDEPKKPEVLVVDGTNVCFWWGHAFKNRNTGIEKMSVRPLLVLLCEIREHGDDFYCIFDASTTSRIRQNGNPKEAGIIDLLLRRYNRHFYRVTGSSQADPAILHYADKHNCRIITDDIYRDFRARIPWLKETHTERLIQGNFQRTGLMTIEKLPYGFMEVEWTTLTRELINRLHNCLASDFDWKKYQAAKEAPPVVKDPATPIIETTGHVESAGAKLREEVTPPEKRSARKARNTPKKATHAKAALPAKKFTSKHTTTKKARRKTKRSVNPTRAPQKKGIVNSKRKSAKMRVRKSQIHVRAIRTPKKRGFLEWLFG